MIDVEKTIKYWQTTAQDDSKAMDCLFAGKHYANSLFFGHLVLEKILKALVVKETKKQASYTHDLVRLYKLANIELSQDQIDLLYQVNEFNIRARYPDEKFRFHKQCTKEYTENYLTKIKNLYDVLCQKLT